MKYILEQELERKMSNAKLSLSPQMLMKYQAIEMCKLSDGISCSGLLQPQIAGRDAIKFLSDSAKKIITASKPKSSKPFKEGIKNFADNPMLDLNWLLALAEHYKVTETEEWQIFKRQRIFEAK